MNVIFLVPMSFNFIETLLTFANMNLTHKKAAKSVNPNKYLSLTRKIKTVYKPNDTAKMILVCFKKVHTVQKNRQDKSAKTHDSLKTFILLFSRENGKKIKIKSLQSVTQYISLSLRACIIEQYKNTAQFL